MTKTEHEQRNTFIFYRSFYEAAKCLPPEIRVAVYDAIISYALDGVIEDNLDGVPRALFVLMRPVLDTDILRRQNGSLGGRPPKADKPADTRSTSLTTDKSNDSRSPAPLTDIYADEIAQLKQDDPWCDSACARLAIPRDTLPQFLDDFEEFCRAERQRPHSSIADAKRHFVSWMRKSNTQQPAPPDDNDYNFAGGFGGKDI